MNYVTFESLQSLLIDMRIELANKVDKADAYRLHDELLAKRESLKEEHEQLRKNHDRDALTFHQMLIDQGKIIRYLGRKASSILKEAPDWH